MNKNYVAYMKVFNEVHEGLTKNINEPNALDEVYNEAKRFSEEYNPTECGVRVYAPDCFKIIDWKNGKHWKGNGMLLYTIKIK